MQERKILAIEAHPDDATFFYGGTLAKFVELGYEVKVLTVTQGEKSTLDVSYIDTPQKLVEDLAEEHKNALQALGVTQHEQLQGFINHNLYASETQMRLREEITRVIRQFRPDTIICFDPANIYEENTDHIFLARIALEAASFSAYALDYSDQIQSGLQPHFVSKMLLTPSLEPNTFVNITGSPLSKKLAAGACYHTQLDLMIGETIKRLEGMGITLEFLAMDKSQIWTLLCTQLSESAAKSAKSPKSAKSAKSDTKSKDDLIIDGNLIALEHAEAFRTVYLGAVEKIRDILGEKLKKI